MTVVVSVVVSVVVEVVVFVVVFVVVSDVVEVVVLDVVPVSEGVFVVERVGGNGVRGAVLESVKVFEGVAVGGIKVNGVGVNGVGVTQTLQSSIAFDTSEF